MLQQSFGIYEKQIVYPIPLKHSCNSEKSRQRFSLLFNCLVFLLTRLEGGFPILSKKAQTINEEMFQVITDAYIIIVNSEKKFWKIINECSNNIYSDDILTHSWFHHLTQATWRKIQNLGLTALYKESEGIRMFYGMMYGLGFYQSIL